MGFILSFYCLEPEIQKGIISRKEYRSVITFPQYAGIIDKAKYLLIK